MRGHILRLLALMSLLIASAGTAHADVCVTIDEARDTLAPQERAAAILLVTSQFEQEGERVLAAGCPTPYVLFHVQLGNTIVVNLSGPGGQREARALGMDDLPAVYSQMVRSIVTGRPMSGFNVVDRTNVTASQAKARRVHSDSIWYARLGYGTIFGDSAYGTPALGFGYRGEMDSFAIDVAFLNYQFRTSDYYAGSSGASAGSLLKLSGLYFVNPEANRSPYFGGGVSYGHRSIGGSFTSTTGQYQTGWDGHGLQGELTAGYELARATSLRMFLQADAILPFYHVKSETFTRFGAVTATDRRYVPSLVVSVGIGR
jgi:hypothetical protein